MKYHSVQAPIASARHARRHIPISNFKPAKFRHVRSVAHNPSANAFETEITFLLQHFHKIKMAMRRQMTFGCDFSPTLDVAYADVTLKGRQQRVFQAVYQETRKTIGSPDFLIHLKCNPVEELRRIRRRRRTAERSITTDYLTALNAALARRLTRQSAHTEIIEIDSGRIDFAHDNDCQTKVLTLIQRRLRADEK
ncbi:MAG: hypothetical protein D4R74_04990 [Betaproteobacteria bacterium]|nr:MAG: hypothetical protein D4R74_04990 [Betaproteobacteria bacterium]